MKNKKKQNSADWIKLDNAALIYPSSSNESWNNVFRVSAYLTEDVDPNILQNALDIVIERFSSFDVTLRRGMFWYYFQKMDSYPQIEEEKVYPCRMMDLNKKKHLFRVLYFKNKISFETFHALTDGTGALAFLNDIVGCYLNLSGKIVDDSNLEYHYKDKPNPEEIEDSFKRYADKSGTGKRNTKSAYQIHGTPEPNGVLDVITAVVDSNKFNQIAKQNGATITQLLTSLYAKCIINYQNQLFSKNKPVIISVPVNLRKFFKTKTLRNFSSWLDVEFEGKNKTENLAELIEETKRQMQSITKENMLKNINANVNAEKNFFVRIMPLFVKNLALSLSYKIFGERAYTSVITNLGKVNVPKDYEKYVERYDCLLCKSMVNTINIACVTFGDKMSITFTSSIKENTIEKNMIRAMKELGVDVTIYTNMR